jgi:hypothetical protein
VGDSGARHLRLALLLGLASAVTVLLVFPYLLELTPALEQTSKVSLPVLVMLQSLQGGVLSFLLAWAGLALGAPRGLDSPILRAWVYGSPIPAAPVRLLPRSSGIGLVVGIVVSLLDWLFFWGAQPEAVRKVGLAGTLWKGALASFYGGIAEEVLTRLFLTTLLVFLISKLTRRLGPGVFVSAIVIGALIFAAGHLPTIAQIAPLAPVVVARVLVLNSVAGIVFGVLFWLFGLEQAMLAHFSTDLVLHVVAPALAR